MIIIKIKNYEKLYYIILSYIIYNIYTISLFIFLITNVVSQFIRIPKTVTFSNIKS